MLKRGGSYLRDLLRSAGLPTRIATAEIAARKAANAFPATMLKQGHLAASGRAMRGRRSSAVLCGASPNQQPMVIGVPRPDNSGGQRLYFGGTLKPRRYL